MININNISCLLLILIIPSLVSGPFLPDLFLSLIGILFLINYFFLKINIPQYNIAYNFILPFFLFYLVILLSSFLSDNIIHSLESSLFYFRFGIFAIAIPYLIQNNSKILNYIFYFALTTFFIVSLDGLYEIINGKNIFGNYAGPGRIAGLFGDEWVIGSFLSRILPVIIFIYIYNQDKKNQILKFVFFLTVLISFFTILLSGERAALLFSLITFFLYFILLVKNYFLKYKKLFILIMFPILIILLTPFVLEKSSNRIFNNFDSHTSFDPNTNIYLGYYDTAYQMFLTKPLLGHGPKSFRIKCNYFKNVDLGCNTHPHNTYFQLLAETGLIGFFFIIILFIYTCFNLLKILIKKNINYFDLCKYSLLICIFINTFPFVPTGNFFNNWLSVIYFLPISLYLYLLDAKKDKFN